MNDRELLELAAKGAGYEVVWNEGWSAFQHKNPVPDAFGTYRHPWVPLTDDGDVLRLATRLCMSISTGPCEARANTIPGALRGNFFKEDTVHQDHDEAVRRVIVRAAAEVGENMP